MSGEISKVVVPMIFLGALRCDRLKAPCVFDGPINGQLFRAYVEQQFVPTLRQGDIVIMTNLGSHIVGNPSQNHTGCGCKALVPATILTRPQSH